MFFLTSLNKNMNQLMDEFFNDSFLTGQEFVNTFRLDVKESETSYIIEAELPGISKEEIKVEYYEGRLFISVMHNEEINEEKDNYIHKERKMSSMQRFINIGNIDREHLTAKLEQGILTIVAPKTEPIDKRLQIEIK